MAVVLYGGVELTFFARELEREEERERDLPSR